MSQKTERGVDRKPAQGYGDDIPAPAKQLAVRNAAGIGWAGVWNALFVNVEWRLVWRRHGCHLLHSSRTGRDNGLGTFPQILGDSGLRRRVWRVLRFHKGGGQEGPVQQGSPCPSITGTTL